MSYGFNPPPPYYPGAMEGGGAPSAPPYNQTMPPPYQPPPYQSSGRTAVIRNASSGLCLDGSEYEVKLQHYNGTPGQQWILEPMGGERFMIRNKSNMYVLDIEGGPDCGANLITYEAHGGDNQQWFINPDRTIVSAAGNLAIDVCDGNPFPGNILIAYDRHGGPNQLFDLQYL